MCAFLLNYFGDMSILFVYRVTESNIKKAYFCIVSIKKFFFLQPYYITKLATGKIRIIMPQFRLIVSKEI